jgi:acetamidase/formamidase
MHKRDVYVFRSLRKTVFAMALSVSLVAATGAMAFDQHKHLTVASNEKSSPDKILQRMSDHPCKLPDGSFYAPAALNTMQWGFLPNRNAKPILSVPSNSVLTFDNLSSEGMVEDQGRDPVKFFGKFGVPESDVLKDAVEICASNVEHNMATDGPHIIIGPIAVEGAQPGDVLKVEMISMEPRVPYGIVGNRPGKGALPAEYPQNDGPKPGASKEHPELFGSVFSFIPIKSIAGKMFGTLKTSTDKEIRFPIQPFMGTMGVAPNTAEKVSSIPPSSFGGNLDLKDLTVGSSLYLPIQVEGGMFFMGDPHFNQGDGEVALTALEASLRTKVRLKLLKAGDPNIPVKDMKDPFAETPDYWMPIGLDTDLDNALKKTVRTAIKFLSEKMNMDNATALSYLSAATDFEITQVVDETKGVHAHISKKDFEDVLNLEAKH